MIHDSMPYDPIQGQGHRGPKVVKVANFKVHISSAGILVNKRLTVNYDNVCPDVFLIFVVVKSSCYEESTGWLAGSPFCTRLLSVLDSHYCPPLLTVHWFTTKWTKCSV